MPPVVNLKPTVLPLLTVRATMIGDLLANHGFSRKQIEIAQQGYIAGWLDRVMVVGTDFANNVQDVITLWFDKLEGDPKVTVDTTGGKSMLEAVSVPLAGAVSYGVSTLKRKGLKPNLLYGFAPWLDQATADQASSSLGLVRSGDALKCADGYAMREILYIRPGADKGTHFSHQSARRAR